MSLYADFAHYYDLLHDDLTVDIGWVLTLAARCPGPVLELGCGSGRLLLPLARAGHQVTGIDNAPAMLARARRRLAPATAAVQARVTLIEADIRQPPLSQRYGLILIPYNTLMHFDVADVVAMLAAIRPLLLPDGCLAIDLIHPDRVAETPNDHMVTLERRFTDPEHEEELLLFAANEVDIASQQLHITWLFDAMPPGGGTVRRTVLDQTVRYWYPDELTTLLETAGFPLTAIYGDYNLAPMDSDSQRMLLVAG